IKEKNILSGLYVNTNQTQVVYAQGSNLTWTKTGAKQVSTIGNDGMMLPLQAIYQGHSKMSCPNPLAANYENCIKGNFHVKFSNIKTYWSTQVTMHTLIDEIVAPYCERKKQELGLSQTQKLMWQIDTWSVHQSLGFQTWLKKNHLMIVLNFVSGGCTGLFRPCDVGMQ
ncbi:hypothetical protein CY34DRAFT_89647, partial [Suillus luteus UH-Slu-Lm8-n1]